MAYTKDPAKRRGTYRVKPFDEGKFWSMVNKDVGNGCWEWTGYACGNGRPYWTMNRKTHPVYRIAWFLTVGEWPPFGMCLCHRCDNGRCCNPSHLFIGTHKDNTQDMWIKGRQQKYEGFPTGEKHHQAMLTNAQAREIMEEWKSGRWKTRKALAAARGVPKDTVNNIVKGLTYREAMV